MNKKFLIGSIFLVILIIFFITYWYYNTQNIRKKVLNNLEQQLEFCSILKDNILFNKGEFWLICNERPFYATYNNGTVRYDFNGWGFLQQDVNFWKELIYCDFYKSEKVNNNYNLVFFCQKDFDSEEIFVKVYQFNPYTLKTVKVDGDENFLEILEDDIKNKYSFLQNCKIENLKGKSLQSLGIAPLVFKMNKTITTISSGRLYTILMDCNEYDVFMKTDLKNLFALPFVNISNNILKNTEFSFKKIFSECEINDIKEIENCVYIKSNCPKFDIDLSYCFFDVFGEKIYENYYNFTIKDSLENLMQDFTNLFLLPPVKNFGNIQLVKEDLIKCGRDRDCTLNFFKKGDSVFGFVFDNEKIIGVLKLCQNIFC